MGEITAKCQVCSKKYKMEHYKIGLTINCPICNNLTEVVVVKYSSNSRYQITYKQFSNLLFYEPHSKVILPIIKKWFNCEAIFNGKVMVFKTGTGEFSVENIHKEIQCNPRLQYDLYQEAMTLWR
ncbi:hypothetical protein ASG81_24125 [Paenibacillus sp. Soil522]|nr:hypothetical protein ASG81_24125 [Paenibacillus sp. Soil522]